MKREFLQMFRPQGRDLRFSQQVLEWQAEAAIVAQRAIVQRLLERRCGTAVPADIIDLIQSIKDFDTLILWFDAAVDVSSFDEFRAAIQAPE